jgi:hypothetical protein
MTGLPVHAQVTALRIAFPGYQVNLLSRRGERPRIEVVAKDGSSDPYCLISTDPREIWAELRQAIP